MELSFTLWTLITTYELGNVTHATRARWVGRNSGLIFRRLWTQVHQIVYDFLLCFAGPALGTFEVFGRTGPQNLGGRNFGP